MTAVNAVQEQVSAAQLQQQRASEQQATSATADAAHIKELALELKLCAAALHSTEQELQHAQQSRDMIQGQVEAWRAQHAQQAPKLAELVQERRAWVEELQRERAAASAAACAAEASQVIAQEETMLVLLKLEHAQQQCLVRQGMSLHRKKGCC